MSVTLDRLMHAAALMCETSPADVRLGWDDRALTALAIYSWLAERCTRTTVAEAARHAGRPLSVMLEARSVYDAFLGEHPAEFERLSIEAHAQIAGAGIEYRRGRLAPDVDPADIARRLVLDGPSALTVGRAQLAALGAAYLSLVATRKEAAHG